jgi:hypothetical protein
MANATPRVADRWFDVGLRLFAAGTITAAMMVVVTAGMPPVRPFALLALLFAVCGVIVCAVGVRVVHPDRWPALRTTVHEFGANIGRGLRWSADESAPQRSG